MVLNLQICFLIFWNKLWYLLKGFLVCGYRCFLWMVKGKIHMKLYIETLFDNLTPGLLRIQVETWFCVNGCVVAMSRRIIARSSAGKALAFKGTMIILKHQEPHALRHGITFWKTWMLMKRSLDLNINRIFLIYPTYTDTVNKKDIYIYIHTHTQTHTSKGEQTLGDG